MAKERSLNTLIRNYHIIYIMKAIKYVLPVIVSVLMCSCVTSYDRYGNPIQTVDPVAATIGAVAIGAVAYNAGQHDGYYNNGYYNKRYNHYNSYRSTCYNNRFSHSTGHYRSHRSPNYSHSYRRHR